MPEFFDTSFKPGSYLDSCQALCIAINTKIHYSKPRAY